MNVQKLQNRKFLICKELPVKKKKEEDPRCYITDANGVNMS